MKKGLISFVFYVHPMDGEDLLEYLPSGSKWAELNKLQQLIVLIILFGTVYGALTAMKIFLFDSIIPTARWGGNMTTIAYYGFNIGWLWNSPFFS